MVSLKHHGNLVNTFRLLETNNWKPLRIISSIKSSSESSHIVFFFHLIYLFLTHPCFQVLGDILQYSVSAFILYSSSIFNCGKFVFENATVGILRPFAKGADLVLTLQMSRSSGCHRIHSPFKAVIKCSYGLNCAASKFIC